MTPHTSDIATTRLFWTRQVQRLAMLTTIDLHLIAKGLPNVAAGLLQHVSQVEPALQMSAAELAFFVGLVAGALELLLVLELVLGELRRVGRAHLGHEGSIAQ